MNIFHDTRAGIDSIFNTSNLDFESLALQIFHFQYKHNQVYRQFCHAIKVSENNINLVEKIPFLPIGFFKTKDIVTGSFTPEIIFESSGTTADKSSRHLLKSKSLYVKSFLDTFRLFYGDPAKYCIIGLLPSYLERKNSSLVFMVNELIKLSGNKFSGFYLYDTAKLYETIIENEKQQQHTLLIGVTYALLDFAEKYPMKLQYTTVMETGGMKGRREELTRQEVHEQLKQRLGLHEVHSEYGMTELLSQAYSAQAGIFYPAPWMKVLIRSEDDPFDIIPAHKIKGQFVTGAINIIDLANIYSCPFIATDDMGKLHADESFEVLGRLDNSDLRGCGLMLL